MTGDTVSKRSMAVAPISLDSADVEAFLRDHPQFFQQRPELLTAMALPHGGEGSVSLVERQVALLRERNIETRSRLAELTQNAEASEALFEASQRMILAILESDDTATLRTTVEAGLIDFFGVEYAAHIWLGQDAATLADAVEDDTGRLTTLQGLLRRQRAYCGVFRSDEMAALFPACDAEGSAAIAPLEVEGQLVGALAVGSSDVNRYDSTVGTLFLEYLAEVITRLPCLGPLRTT